MSAPPAAPAALSLMRAGDELGLMLSSSISENTRRAYASALRTLDAALDGEALTDATLALHLARLRERGQAPATLAMVVAAANFRARMRDGGSSGVSGPLTERALAGAKRLDGERGRGQAQPVRYEQVLAMQSAAAAPRRRGRRRETSAQAQARALIDRAMIGLAFLGGLRRSEISTLTWGMVKDAEDDPEIVLVRLPRSKANPTGERVDVRAVKGPGAAALRLLRFEAEAEGRAAPDAKVIGLSPSQVNRRLQAAAAAAGIDGISAHSFRVGLASELTARGASTTETMLAGGWTTSRMVAHYAADAKAERGAVAKYL